MTDRLPIFPLRTVLFPGDLLPLHIFEPRYRLMLSQCAEMNPCFGVVLTRSGSEVGDQPGTFDIGTSAMNVEHVMLPDGRSNLLVKGARRYQILGSDWEQSYMVATIRWLDSPGHADAGPVSPDHVDQIRVLLARYLDAYNRATGQMATFREFDDEPTSFAYAVAATVPMPLEVRQMLLEATPPDQLLSRLGDALRHETALLTQTGASAYLPGRPGARFTSN